MTRINAYILFALAITVSTFIGGMVITPKDANYLLELYAYKELYFLMLNIIVVGIFAYKLYSLIKHSFLKTYIVVLYKDLLEIVVLLFLIFALYITVKIFAVCLWTTLFLVEMAPLIQNSGLPINFEDVVISFMTPSQDLPSEASRGDIPPMGGNVVTAKLTSKREPFVCANVKRILTEVLEPGVVQTACKAGRYYLDISDVECVTFEQIGDTPFSAKKS